MKRPIMAIGMAVMLTCALLFGCANFTTAGGSEHLAIQYATMKVIEADKDAMSERAAKINELATTAQSLLDADATDITLLSDAIKMRLPPDLSPADRVLANALINAVVAELQVRVSNGVAPLDKKLQINVVLGWIREATQFYAS